MNNKFYNGDLVKILNLSNYQIESIHSQTCNRPNVAEIIGQMYYVDQIEANEEYSLIGWNHGGYHLTFKPSQLQLICTSAFKFCQPANISISASMPAAVQFVCTYPECKCTAHCLEFYQR